MSQATTGSDAFRDFQTNLDNVGYLLRAVLRDTEQLNESLESVKDLQAHTTGLLGNLKKGDSNFTDSIGQVSVNLDSVTKHFDEFLTNLKTNLQVHPFIFDWMLVMTVTFAEAYLETVLLLLTEARPAWMQTKDRVVVSGADVLGIEANFDAATRWQGLMALLRARWAKQFLS